MLRKTHNFWVQNSKNYVYNDVWQSHKFKVQLGPTLTSCIGHARHPGWQPLRHTQSFHICSSLNIYIRATYICELFSSYLILDVCVILHRTWEKMRRITSFGPIGWSRIHGNSRFHRRRILCTEHDQLENSHDYD